jgi:hypothetical protein
MSDRVFPCRIGVDDIKLAPMAVATEVMSLENDMLPMLVSSAVRSSASLEEAAVNFLTGDTAAPH